MCYEFMIQVLEKSGYTEFLILVPAMPKQLREKFAPYARELSGISKAYTIPIEEPDLGNAEFWKIAGGGDDILGRYPNKSGHAKFAEILSDAFEQ